MHAENALAIAYTWCIGKYLHTPYSLDHALRACGRTKFEEFCHDVF